MKKYYLTDCDEEVAFGDTIVIEDSKKEDDGTKVVYHKEFLFTPDLVDMLLKQEVIVETDEEEEDSEENQEVKALTPEELDDILTDLMDTDEGLLDQVEDLRMELKRLNEKIDKLSISKTKSA